MDHKPTRHIFALLGAIALLHWNPASAEERPQVARTARMVGLGGSLTGIADDAAATFWNPSGISTLQRQEIVFSYADRYGLGLQNSEVGYVFPMFETHAVGLNWTREGFSDAELSDALQVFNVAYALQLHRSISLGLGGKFVLQSIDLDGESLRSASGAGLDVGLLFNPKTGPLGKVRFGVTLQDIGGTKVRDDNTQFEEEIFPQNLRVGTAIQPHESLTIALDVDDRIHGGLEYQPLSALLLRGGLHRQLSPPDGASKTLNYALGLGVRWNNIKVDYAYDHHPVLPATHHASVSLSYNPSLVTVKDALVRPAPVFKSLYRTYEESDFVDVVLRNASQDALPVTVSIDIPTVTKTPHEESVTIPPQSTQRYGFTFTFPNDLLATQSSYYDNLVQPTVKVTYTKGRKSKTVTKRISSVYVLGKGKLSWSNPARIGAFITSESRTVDTFARGVVGNYIDLLQKKFPRNNIGKAAVIFDAISAYGLRYQQDQTTPYLQIFEDDSVFDTVKYPYEFFESKIGDCDDCTALYCALLENLNIPTAILDVNDPQFGHIYMMFDSGIPISDAGDFFVHEKEYVIWEGSLWIPVETTLFGSSFTDAWRNGAEEYYVRKERGFVNEILVSQAQQVFKPGVVPDADVALPSATAIDEIFNRDLAFFENRVDQIALASGVSLESAEGLYDVGATYLRLSQFDRALDLFGRAIQKDPRLSDAYNAKGVILTRRRQYDEAIRFYQKALSLNPSDAGYQINIALTYHLQGKRDDAQQVYQEAVEMNRDFAGMFDFLTRKDAPAISVPAAVDPLQKLAAQKAYDDGAAYLRLKSLEKALDAFDRAVALNPNSADAYNAKGVISTRERKYSEAIGLYQKAIQLDPNNAGFHVNLAITYHLQGKSDEALREYRRTVELDSDYRGQLDFIAGGETLASPGMHAVTSSITTPLQRLAAEKAYDDGAAYLRLNAFDKALDAFDRALALDPKNADAMNAKGVILTRERKHGEAIQLFKSATELDPSDAGFHVNLSIAYHLQGNREDALREYRKAIELDPDYAGQLHFLERP